MPADRRRGRARNLAGPVLASVVLASSVSALAAPAAASPADVRRPATSSAGSPSGRVVVSGPGGVAAASSAVRAAGGTVLDALPLVGGVSAELPPGAALPGFVVAADRPLAVAAKPDKKDAAADTGSQADSGGPASTARSTLGLDATSPRGRGVTVAVVDTGVADVPDLDGRVLHVDVSGSKARTDSGDDYGHGTFVAGLVGGNGAASAGRYQGAAPDARLLDVRVAADDGSTSLIAVLRGLQVVSASADALDVRVLNLSLSSGSPLPYQVDPLTQALEALWRQGVTVVTAAGNDGPAPGSVSSPGLDPTLLTAGALDENGTASRDDDVVADYSSRGSAALNASALNAGGLNSGGQNAGGQTSAGQGVAKPDLVAPGSHLVSLRAPGSVVDTGNPGSRIGTSYFRGSGTSMSTALVSGVVADLLSARPDLTPDQVKALLTSTAYRAAGLSDPTAAGAGGVDVRAALSAPTPTVPSAGDADADAPDPSTLPVGQVKAWDRFAEALLSGDRAAAFSAWNKLSPQARSWVARSWVSLSPEARSWVARSWVARSWVGADGSADDWLARSWAARSWIARSWVARSWVARSWIARSWVARSWVGRSWVGRSWIDDDWADAGWVGRSWVGRSWVGRSWVDDDWLARSWTARSWTARSWTASSWS